MSLTTQELWLRRLFPDARVEVHRSRLTWRGFLTPTPISPLYDILLTYSLNSMPEIFVLSPNLTKNKEGKLPHVFSTEEQKLCLHFPPEKKWEPHRPLAIILLPWIGEWLYFYEIWVATGEWKGGGTHREDMKYREMYYAA